MPETALRAPTVPRRAGKGPSSLPHVQRFAIPIILPLLNANDRAHWAAQNRLIRHWKWVTISAAARIEPVQGRVHIVATLHMPTRRSYDAGNYYPTLKACVDALVAPLRILVDDDNTHVIGPDLRAGDTDPKHPRIVIDLIEEGL